MHFFLFSSGPMPAQITSLGNCYISEDSPFYPAQIAIVFSVKVLLMILFLSQEYVVFTLSSRSTTAKHLSRLTSLQWSVTTNWAKNGTASRMPPGHNYHSHAYWRSTVVRMRRAGSTERIPRWLTGLLPDKFAITGVIAAVNGITILELRTVARFTFTSWWRPLSVICDTVELAKVRC